MRRAILMAGLLLRGCGNFLPPEVEDCETSLLRSLKSPSSYKRVNWNSVEISKEIHEKVRKEVEDLIADDGVKPPYVQVSIEYDADNSYGASLRDTLYCRYAVDSKGKALVDRRLD